MGTAKTVEFVLDEFLAAYQGGISVEEGLALGRYAERCDGLPIIEIGSFQGKSAVALAAGAAKSGGHVFCIEPHATFTGVYGGRFGPDDRGAFYQVMLETGFFRSVTLIGLQSVDAARAWNNTLGLLFIDGDHSIAGVAKDVRSWERHLCVGGVIAFDDALDESIGPHPAIKNLLQSGRFKSLETIGKITFILKTREDSGLQSNKFTKKRILVAWETLSLNGGSFRFERFGRVACERGHDLVNLVLGENPHHARGSDFPIVSLAEAEAQEWDVTMIPGSGFSRDIIEQFSRLKCQNFGLRMQHILNDQSVRERFLRVNSSFQPHVVVFNNRHWSIGDFTDFYGYQFHFLEGAVDTARFAPSRRRETHAKFIIGGLYKNVDPLVNAIRKLGPDVEIRLFGQMDEIPADLNDLVEAGVLKLLGPVGEEELPRFYYELDCVVHTDTAAGWANLAAEAAASGVPLVCTAHGTLAFAENSVSALVMSDPSEDEILANISRIRQDEDLARRLSESGRRAIIPFSWERYTTDLLALMDRDYTSMHYARLPEFGLYGKWPTQARHEGLEELLEECRGAEVLDLGMGEGTLAAQCLEHGASLVHGLDRDPFRVMRARAICHRFAHCAFWRADLADLQRLEETLQYHGKSAYDIVLYLGLHHHIPAVGRLDILRYAASCARRTFVIRTPQIFWTEDITNILNGMRFSLHLKRDEGARHLGPMWIFRREKDA